MDTLIRLIEGLVQAVVSIIQPTVGNGDFSYLFQTAVLVVVTASVIRSTNPKDRIGYIVGILIGLMFINLYMEGGGPSAMINIIGITVRGDFTVPLVFGVVLGFGILLPFAQRTASDKTPVIIGVAAAASVIFLFLTWAASQFPPGVSAPADAMETLLIYRRRYIGFFGLAFTAGVLAHVLMSSPPPPPPAKKSSA